MRRAWRQSRSSEKDTEGKWAVMAIESCLDGSNTEREEEKDFLGSLPHSTVYSPTLLYIKNLSNNSKNCLELVLYFILRESKP